jgi:hypothetical protein
MSDETHEDDEQEYETDENKSYSNVGTEPSEEKQGIVEELYACDKRVYKLINSWAGNDKEDAIAGRKFLNNQFSVLIGIINTTNSFTRKNGDEVQKILYRSNKGFIIDMVNEPTIHRKNYYSLFFTFWHAIELFLGLPRNGHGANVLRDALAGLNTPQEEEQKEGIFEAWSKKKNV